VSANRIKPMYRDDTLLWKSVATTNMEKPLTSNPLLDWRAPTKLTDARPALEELRLAAVATRTSFDIAASEIDAAGAGLDVATENDLRIAELLSAGPRSEALLSEEQDASWTLADAEARAIDAVANREVAKDRFDHASARFYSAARREMESLELLGWRVQTNLTEAFPVLENLRQVVVAAGAAAEEADAMAVSARDGAITAHYNYLTLTAQHFGTLPGSDEYAAAEQEASWVFNQTKQWADGLVASQVATQGAFDDALETYVKVAISLGAIDNIVD